MFVPAGATCSDTMVEPSAPSRKPSVTASVEADSLTAVIT